MNEECPRYYTKRLVACMKEVMRKMDTPKEITHFRVNVGKSWTIFDIVYLGEFNRQVLEEGRLVDKVFFG